MLKDVRRVSGEQNKTNYICIFVRHFCEIDNTKPDCLVR